MNNTLSKPRLNQLRELIKIERDEDFKQYSAHFLRNNINHRKANGLTWYPIKIINTEIGFGDYISIEIERTSNFNEPHQFSGGKSAALFSNNTTTQKSLNGIVKMLGPNKLRLTLNVDELPEWTDQGKLGINLLFDDSSFKEMDAALEQVINSENNNIAKLRSIFYENVLPTFNKNLIPVNINRLSSSQNEAVNLILSANEIAIIHGPPGTGKTSTLIEAIAEVLKIEKQVLVSSPSNTAVDLLTEKLFKAGINVLRLGNPARMSEEVLINTIDNKINSHSTFKLIKENKKKAEEYFRMAGSYKRIFGKSDREQRKLFYLEGQKILKENKKLEEFIADDIFEKAQVIACTPVIAGSKILNNKFFNTLFIDEAAQALEPMCWIPMLKCNRVILAGDHFQLPPTVKSKVAAQGGLSKTLFESNIDLPNASVMLNTQYRMNKEIMSFSSDEFYNANLIAHESVEKHTVSNLDNFPLLNKPIKFIDTSGCSFDEVINPESLSISNPEEANFLINYLKSVIGQLENTKPLEKNILIGIISPYKEQVQLLIDLVNNDSTLKNYRPAIAIKTIDGFQGQEKDIIFISTVRSNNTNEIGFLADTRRMMLH